MTPLASVKARSIKAVDETVATATTSQGATDAMASVAPLRAATERRRRLLALALNLLVVVLLLLLLLQAAPAGGPRKGGRCWHVAVGTTAAAAAARSMGVAAGRSAPARYAQQL
jgi:hypothetical protein